MENVPLKIVSISVDFPYQPYVMQLSMMSRIITALNKEQNCLLESPTGTGKTMAMLCSSLAWVSNQQNKSNDDKENAKKIPKIYFGTRTHKQIGQVVREMSRSSYKNIPMTILSSRKQTCVNSQVVNKPDTEQCCDEARKLKSCLFFNKREMTIPHETWDIESIKSDLKKQLICPYYQTRKWNNKASITFCPYNYILNPSIRKASGINLKNSIVILDEAHNIEDICREGASAEINLENLNLYKMQCLKLLNNDQTMSHISKIINLINSLTCFIEHLASRLVFVMEDVLKKAWDSAEAIVIMKEHELYLERLNEYQFTIDLIIDKMNDENFPNVNKLMLNTLTECITILGNMLNEPTDFQSGYKVVIMEGTPFQDLLNDSESNVEDENGFLSTKRRKKMEPKSNFTLHIICLDPGIIFKDIASETHSIILASGTLSPLTSFPRELSCIFNGSLEAGHVVKVNQTMIASISCGPKGRPLNSTYKNVETFHFQDELGFLLLNCCKTVPHGVLCFLPSFSMIDKLFKRWKATRLVEELRNHKTILIEPRNSMDMNQCMKEYYSYIENGALLLAVYRGKASEGMDFADDAARLVIAVGIPYPSYMDFKVMLKKEYNDNRRKIEQKPNNSLSGQEWYSIQAFRALNQALGRCIRHKDDWGAMIMVDERFGSDYYNSGLCKWIQQRKQHFNKWSEFQDTLHNFVQTHIKEKEAQTKDL